MASETTGADALSITVCFFARLRESLGTEQLSLSLPAGSTVAALLTELASRGGPWEQLNSGQPVMIAVNQTMARPASGLQDGDEVALFPPVTGG